MKGALSISAILLIVILCAWFFVERREVKPSSVEQKFGLVLNEERIKASLPVIEQSWKLKFADSSSCKWESPNLFNQVNVPEHIAKEVTFRAGRVVAEEDVFGYTRGDSIGDRLTIYVLVAKRNSMTCKFRRHFYHKYPSFSIKSVSPYFADSVLKACGFNNLYSQFLDGD